MGWFIPILLWTGAVLIVWYIVGLLLLPWFTKICAGSHPAVGKCLKDTCNPKRSKEVFLEDFGYETIYVPVKDADYETLRYVCAGKEAKWMSVWWPFKLLSLWPDLIVSKKLAVYHKDKEDLERVRSMGSLENFQEVMDKLERGEI